MPGIPRATYMPFPFQIVQGMGSDILFAYEFADATRVVRMNDSTLESPAESWMGWSKASWEGDTLVIDVTDFNDQTWLDSAGNYHSEQLRVTERYTATGPDYLLYEATITDSEGLHAPMDDSDAAVPTYRGERQTPRVQVRRIRRGNDVRPPSEEEGRLKLSNRR